MPKHVTVESPRGAAFGPFEALFFDATEVAPDDPAWQVPVPGLGEPLMAGIAVLISGPDDLRPVEVEQESGVYGWRLRFRDGDDSRLYRNVVFHITVRPSGVRIDFLGQLD